MDVYDFGDGGTVGGNFLPRWLWARGQKIKQLFVCRGRVRNGRMIEWRAGKRPLFFLLSILLDRSLIMII